MKKLILQIFISVDGFVADRNGETAFFDGTDYNLGQEVEDHQRGFIESLDLILLGAGTYRFFEAHSQPKDDAGAKATDSKPAENKLSNELDEKPKIVFSKSLTEGEVNSGAQKNVSLVAGDAAGYITDLKKAGDQKMVVWGSLSLAQSLLEAGLFEEIQLITSPVAIGKGTRLFSDEVKLLPLKLTEAKTFSGGATLHTYEPQKPLF